MEISTHTFMNRQVLWKFNLRWLQRAAYLYVIHQSDTVPLVSYIKHNFIFHLTNQFYWLFLKKKNLKRLFNEWKNVFYKKKTN